MRALSRLRAGRPETPDTLWSPAASSAINNLACNVNTTFMKNHSKTSQCDSPSPKILSSICQGVFAHLQFQTSCQHY